MKIFIAIAFFFLPVFKLTAQSHSDLYLYVDSIIKHQLKFKPTLAVKYDSLIRRQYVSPTEIVIRDQSTIPRFPLIIINQHSVEIDRLNRASLKDVKNINVLKDSLANILYGSAGIYGVIVISGNKKLSKKILRK